MTTMTDSFPWGRADRPAANHPTNLVGLADCIPADLLGLAVRRPAAGVCVVTVEGEVDILTAPLLQACVREQITRVPTHLILDLEPVRFLALAGLNCLLQARELAQQTTSVQLHLAGLVTRAAARPLEVTGLLERFDSYPSVADALTTLIGSTEVRRHGSRRPYCR